jgi:hypothetical protein
MQTRYRAAATALLLTATGGMAATGGAAQASGTHHTSSRAAHAKVVTIKSHQGSVTLSDSSFRPGNTVFKVKNRGSRGLVQVFRLRQGYTLDDAFRDIPQLFTDPPTAKSIKAVNRVDKNNVFYGGMSSPRDRKDPASKWAVKIDKPGTYYVVNLDKNLPPVTFTAAGAMQKRPLPPSSGRITAVSTHHGRGNDFRAGKHNAASGWMSTANKALEPHFVEVDQVKPGTKDKDVTRMFHGGPVVFVRHGASAGTGVISPGHRFLWSYHVPHGRYAAMCFWPSKRNGMPHALMGMHAVFNLG